MTFFSTKLPMTFKWQFSGWSGRDRDLLLFMAVLGKVQFPPTDPHVTVVKSHVTGDVQSSSGVRRHANRSEPWLVPAGPRQFIEHWVQPHSGAGDFVERPGFLETLICLSLSMKGRWIVLGTGIGVPRNFKDFRFFMVLLQWMSLWIYGNSERGGSGSKKNRKIDHFTKRWKDCKIIQNE